jgi:hypothetical protein
LSLPRRWPIRYWRRDISPQKQEADLPSIQLGQLLIEQGVLSQSQVDHILKVQKMSHRPFGDLAERLFGIDAKAVEDAWVEQYVRITGVVDLDEQRLDTQCLRLLNQRQAWQFHLLPMHRQQEDLHMATSQQDLIKAVTFSGKKLDEPVHFLIAERDQLREFLMKHYPVPEYFAKFAAER